jgi:hypothetical protein
MSIATFIKSHARTISRQGPECSSGSAVFFLLRLLFYPEVIGKYIPPERQAISEVCGLKTQGNVLLIVTIARASDPLWTQENVKLETYSTQIYHPYAETSARSLQKHQDRDTRKAVKSNGSLV